ncbi:MAG: filamentous hemagglutinin family protein, partial [Bradyrhizobium sp.]|nr:filamentous hemagglutinin family protein [Bradyrhizobium sp.]
DGSFSYDFVAGAAPGSSSANPDAVVPPGFAVPAAPSSARAGVIINGHTTYTDPETVNSVNLTIDIPTLVRTGTGSIDIKAAANVEFADSVAPGAVYTAGALVVPPAGFKAPPMSATYLGNPNDLLAVPGWSIGGGAVTITAGQSIIGIETPTGSQYGVMNGPTGQLWSDWYMHYGMANGTATPFSACASGNTACQTSAWVNFNTFFQGFGALGGGNITLTAGLDIVDVGASLPETLVVSGGTGGANPVATYYGGGNLVVKAGRNLLSSDFLVGRGTGLIQAGGFIQADPSNPITAMATMVDQTVLPLLLAEQHGFVTIAARGAITLGDVFDPASLPISGLQRTQVGAMPGANGVNDPDLSQLFTTFGPGSGVALTSTAGDATALTFDRTANLAALFLHDNTTQTLISVGGLLLPATLDIFALQGNIDLSGATNANLVPIPTQTGSDTGTIDLVAAQSIHLGPSLNMPDLTTTVAQHVGESGVGTTNYISPLGLPLPNLTEALHANDPQPVIIAAGQDLYLVNAAVHGGSVTSMSLIKPAIIEAGNNIYGALTSTGALATPTSGTLTGGASFVGQNNNPGDITSIIAGNDLVGGSYELYGPGFFLMQAGHDMGPFTSSGQGIMAVGNGSNLAGLNISGSNLFKPYLPAQGAELDVLFGVKPGIDYAGTIASYGSPSTANGMGFATGAVAQLQDFAIQLIDLPIISARLRSSATGDPATFFQGKTSDQINAVLASLAAAVGLIDPQTHKPPTFSVTATDVQSLQQAQSEAKLDQQVFSLIAARATTAGIANPVTLSVGDAVALYQAMAGLQVNQELDVLASRAGLTSFSSSLGVQDLISLHLDQQRVQGTIDREYTDFLAQVGVDAKTASSPYFGQYARAYQAIETLFPAALGYTDNSTGNGNGAASKIATGQLNVASSVLETQMGGDVNILGPGGGITVGHSSRDVLAPDQEGIITLAGGNIGIFADDSVMVNQSRIMTQQGGDIDVFVANGDISAGSGPKTYASSPAFSEICTKDGYCFVNPQGLVTGAGIAAILTRPGQDPSKSNVTLVAPHGTIDLGSAGLRGTTVTLAAPTVLNSFNAQAGNVLGLAFTPPPNTAALTTASNATAATQQSGIPAPGQQQDQPSVILVEFLGFGGDDGSGQPRSPNDGTRKSPADGRQSYNPNSAVEYVGAGAFTDEQKRRLIDSE